MSSSTSRYLVSEIFHFKSKNTLFRRAGVKSFHFKISSEKRYRDSGQEIGKYCPLPEPIRLQDSQDTARSRSKKQIKDYILVKRCCVTLVTYQWLVFFGNISDTFDI